MNIVSNKQSIANVILNYEKFCNNLEELIIQEGLNTTIDKTKIGFYQKELRKISSTSVLNDSDTKLIYVTARLSSLNLLFNKSINSYFNFSSKMLLNMVKGSPSLDDSNERFNDEFFELEMAIRFLIKIHNDDLGSIFSIDLNTDCDLIIDRKLAIECKYIHSSKGLESNVNKAIKQIQSRVSDGLAEKGIIAVDLTNIMPIDELTSIAQRTFDEFYSITEKISNKSFMSDVVNNNISQSVINNSNFSNILQSYYSAYLEKVFYENLNISTKNKITNNTNIKAIIFQSRHLINISTKESMLPIANRGLTYYISESLDEKESESMKSFILNLV